VASEGARLFLWATTGFLRESFDVIQAWGFEYRSQIIWCKPQMGIGNYCRVSHEILMIATRPGIKAWDGRDKAIKSWHVADRTKHSEKPELFRGIVEKLSPGPYLELFGRVTAKGWTTHGNQICRSEG
jgi:N6-adenosine-specific RNA methylase IME4